MSVNKTTGFAAPYKSNTFRFIAEDLKGRSGVLRYDGEISEAGGSVDIPPMVFVQNGLIVRKSIGESIVVPPSLPQPFFLVATAPSNSNLDDIVYTFAKSAQDITINSVIIAEKANGQWRKQVVISADGILLSLEQERLDYQLSKPVTGLLTSYGGGNLTTEPGVAIDKQGQRVENTLPVVNAAIGADPDWNRVDRIVFRRPLGAYNRVPEVTQLLGGTYSAGPQSMTPVALFSSADGHTRVKTLILPDNSLVVLSTEGYGEDFDLVHTRYAEDRTTVLSAPSVILSNLKSDEFDAVVNDASVITIAYTVGSKIVASRHTGATGVIIGSAVDITSASDDIYPRMAVFSNGDIAFAFLRLLSPGNRSVMATIFSSGLSLIKSTTNLSGVGNFDHMAITADRNSLLHVAFRTVSTLKISYGIYDNGLLSVEPFAVISDGTEHPTHGVLSSDTKLPKIVVSHNEEVFVLFLQEKPTTDYGLSVWQNGEAYMVDLASASENIEVYDAGISEVFGALNITLALAANEIHYVKLLDKTPYIQLQLSGTDGALTVSAQLDIKGSLVHSYSKKFPGTYTNYAGPFDVEHIGPQVIVGALNNVSLTNKMCLVAEANKPKRGDRFTVTGSLNGNNGTYYVESVTTVNLNAPSDYAQVEMTAAFPNPESDPTNTKVNYAFPDGMEATFIKSVSETAAKAFLVAERNSDVLLARVIQPGNVVLNYFSGSGSLVNSDTIGIFGVTQYGWETTSPNQLDVTNDLELVDFINNLVYTIGANNLALSEDDAVYVKLDGLNLTPAYQIAPINALPLSEPIQVIGFVKNNIFYPHLLAKADVGALESGETVIIGNDLAPNIRTKLGIVNDTTFEAFTSTTIIGANDSVPAAISKLDAGATAINTRSNDDRLLKLIGGGTWYWNLASNELNFSADAYIQMAEFANDRNRIQSASSPISLTADGQVAYVNLNRVTDAATNLAVSVSLLSALVPTNDTYIIARRVGNNILLSNGVELRSGDRIEVDAVLAELNRFMRKLELKTVASNPKRVRITVPESLMLDGSKLGQVISSLMLDPLFEAQIDVTSGVVYKGDGITPLGQNFTYPTIPATQFRWFGVSLVPSGLNGVGEMEAQVLVLPAIANGVSAAAATKEGAALAGDIPIGWFYVQRNALDTDIENITDANFIRTTVAGGSGGGSGNADDLLTLLYDYMDEIFAQHLSANIFRIHQQTKVASATGTFNFASKVYDFTAAQNLVSESLLDDRFLAKESDVSEVSIALTFDRSAIDTAPAVEVSRNGGAEYQAVTLEQLDTDSDTYHAHHVFEEEVAMQTVATNDVSNADASLALDATTNQARSQEFTVAGSNNIAQVLNLYVIKTGTPSGYLKVNLHQDNAGNPGPVLSQSLFDVSGLSAGNNILIVDIGRHFIKDGTKYHLSFETDATYKASYVAATHEVLVRVDSSAPSVPDSKTYNGTAWSTVTGSAFVYLVEGRVLDLIIRYTAGATAKLRGYGVYYGFEAATVERVKRRYQFVFHGTNDKASYNLGFLLPWDADPDFVECLDIFTGQTWKVPAFELRNNLAVFPADLWDGREIVQILFQQIEAGSYDGNPELLKLAQENHTGSMDPTLDRSVSGRGNLYRNSGGIMVELTLDADNNIVIKET